MRSPPPRLLDDPEIGPALAEELAEAGRYDPSELRRRTLDGAAAGSNGLATTAGAGAVAGLGVAALVAAGLWLFPRVAPEGSTRSDDSARLSPNPDATGPQNPLAVASRGAKPLHDEGFADDFVGPPMLGFGDPVEPAPVEIAPSGEPAPEPSSPTPPKPRTRGRASAVAAPSAPSAPREPRPGPEPGRDVAAAEVSRPAGPTEASIAPALPSGEARTTGLDDLASDLEDYDRGHASLVAGDLEGAVNELRDYLEARPLGRLRLEARLDLLEALIRLNRPAEALPLAEELLVDPAADNRRAELIRVAVELRVATGDCQGAGRLASKGSRALLEVVQKCEDGGG